MIVEIALAAALTLQEQFDADIKESQRLSDKYMAQDGSDEELEAEFRALQKLRPKIDKEAQELFDQNTEFFKAAAPAMEKVVADLAVRVQKINERQRKLEKVARAIDYVIMAPIRIPIKIIQWVL